MTKVVKRGNEYLIWPESLYRGENDDKTIYYMIIGFVVGALVSLAFFEYYWVGVGGGTGMLLGIIVATIVDYAKAKSKPVAVAKKEGKKPAKKATKKPSKAKKAVK